jgi:hypothetical protein
MTLPHAKPVVCALLALLLAGWSVRAEEDIAEDWPHLRGPRYDAISRERGLVSSWPASGPPVLWVRELGQGYAGFIAVGGRVFTQAQSRTGLFVLCLDASTGSEVWRQRVDWPWQPAGAYPGPYATPTWHDGRIYYSTPTGLVGCLDASNGRSVWSVDVRRKFEGEGTEFGYAATPLVEDGRVILPVGGLGASLVAIDPRNGSTLWAAGDDPASYCPIYPITFNRKRHLIGFLRNALVAHDPATGKRLWRVELSTHYDEHSAWPLYAEPHLFVSSPFRAGARVFRLEQSEKIATVWANRVMSNDVCSCVLVDGHVYGFDLQQLQASAHRASRGKFKCLDFLTGKVRWQTDKVGQATALVADGKLLLLTDTGTLILARVNPTAYEELARSRVLSDGVCWTPPTMWRGHLFVRNQSRAVCLFLGDPDKLDPDREPAELPTGPWFDVTRLLSREPDYPHDAPSAADVAFWFAWCVLGVFGPAAAIASVIRLAALALRFSRPWLWTRTAFAASAFLLGLAGTTVGSAWADRFVLTWPASLYVAFRVTLAAITWAEAQPMKRKPRWLSRTMTLLFLAVCYGYYRLCMAVGYVMAWSFLAGFLPAAPAAVVAARARKWWVRAAAEVAGFSIYFMVSGLLPGWKDGWFG